MRLKTNIIFFLLFLFVSCDESSQRFDVSQLSTNKEVLAANCYLPIIKNGKIGFIDKNCNIVISPEFEIMGPKSLGTLIISLTNYPLFSEDLAVVKKDNLYGFIDKGGIFSIPPTYAFASNFSEGLAPVAKASGLTSTGDNKFSWGYIDRSNKLIIPYRFQYCKMFSDDLAAIEVGGNWGYIDKKGNIVIDPVYDNAYNFVDGYACVVKSRTNGFDVSYEYIVINKNEKKWDK